MQHDALHGLIQTLIQQGAIDSENPSDTARATA
jgi:hypothetical protein